jgi:hypothetical protein
MLMNLNLFRNNMLKKDKRPADNAPALYTGSSSSSAEGKDKAPSTISSNFSASSHATSEPVLWDTLDPFTVFDGPENAVTTPKLPTVTRQSKPILSSSTPQQSALQAPFEQGSKSATTAADQIQADKMEVMHIIAHYAVEPLEMLHLGML